MRIKTACSACLMLILLTALCCASALAGGPDLADVVAKVKEIYTYDNVARTQQDFEAFRDAGLSFQPELLAPLTGVAGCKDQEGLRLLGGVYVADSKYAREFGHLDIFTATRDAIMDQVLWRLEARDRVEAYRFDDKLLEALRTNPDDEAARQAWYKANYDMLMRQLDAAEHDPEVLDVTLDTLYGSAVEAAWLACTLARSSGSDAQLVRIFNNVSHRMQLLQAVLHYATDNQTLAARLETTERDQVLTPIIQLIMNRNGSLRADDIQGLLFLLAPEREQMTALCK
ncbi:MAG: hypothetical protein AB7D57_05465 [Desulfovibrionaceae bacterium]